jgi:hypothetical protein
MPYSFRYYHLIISFIQENIDPNRKKYLGLKSQISMAFENTRSVKAELGLIEDKDKKKEKSKLSYKTSERLAGEKNILNHFNSTHCYQV